MGRQASSGRAPQDAVQPGQPLFAVATSLGLVQIPRGSVEVTRRWFVSTCNGKEPAWLLSHSATKNLQVAFWLLMMTSPRLLPAPLQFVLVVDKRKGSKNVPPNIRTVLQQEMFQRNRLRPPSPHLQGMEEALAAYRRAVAADPQASSWAAAVEVSKGGRTKVGWLSLVLL